MNFLAMSGSSLFLCWLLIFVCTFLILVILVQKGRGSGLSGAFGGGGGGSAVFGAKTGDVFTWITTGLTAVLVLLVIVSNYVFEPPAGQVIQPGVVGTTPNTVPAGTPGTTPPVEGGGVIPIDDIIGDTGTSEDTAGEGANGETDSGE